MKKLRKISSHALHSRDFWSFYGVQPHVLVVSGVFHALRLILTLRTLRAMIVHWPGERSVYAPHFQLHFALKDCCRSKRYNLTGLLDERAIYFWMNFHTYFVQLSNCNSLVLAKSKEIGQRKIVHPCSVLR